MTTPKVLFVLTSQDTLGDTGTPTGWYLPEVSHPYAVFTTAGYEIDFVSPRGGEPPMDGGDSPDPISAAFLADDATRDRLRTTLTPDEVSPQDYVAIFYAGGHGAMWDFPDNVRLAQIAAAIYDADGVVGAVCHGPAGLVNITLSDGSSLVDGKEVSTFTNEEEAAVGRTNIVPFLLESRLAERGARITKTANFVEHTAESGRLVTGQNPASATAVAEAMVRVLRAAPAPITG